MIRKIVVEEIRGKKKEKKRICKEYGMIGEGAALENSTCTTMNIKAIFFRRVDIEFYLELHLELLIFLI